MAVEEGKRRPRVTLQERFWAKVQKSDGCWLWAGAKMPNGYGEFGVGDHRYQYAHRFSYALAKGAVPAGLDVDHLCRNRLCVNPAHLEAVTRRENVIRGLHPKMVAHRENRCCAGHALTPDNVGLRKQNGKTYRKCKRCHREREASRRLAKKEVRNG
jgi:hypothetical protein